MITWLTHNRVQLALHELSAGDGGGVPLLLLHGLGERSPDTLPAHLVTWPGPVHALDFTGHGVSTVPAGGGYTAEILMADADIALEHLGRATLLGRGLGAYIALLLCGAQPSAVRGTILADGPGIVGSSTGPGSPHVPWVDPTVPAPPDPFALVELTHDIRPPDYATSFARLATVSSPLETPIAVVAVHRPDWLAAVAAEPGVGDMSLDEALALYASAR